jgi:hypothetical protein
MPRNDRRPEVNRADLLARRRRRKPWLSFALLAVVLILWYRYWVPPAATWLWHAVHKNAVGWHGRSIAVPKGWYARWPGGQPELRHLASPLAQDARVTVLALPSTGGSVYDNFRAHAPEFARQSKFAIQTIRTFVHGENRAFCLQGFNAYGLNEECAFSNTDFGLLYRGSATAERDFEEIVRSVLK